MIEVKGLCAGYSKTMILKNVDFRVEKGGFVGILGPNACGKSTLVKVLSGILTPSSGSVVVGGSSVTETPPLELARKVAVIPQSTEIPFPFTGEELVAMGRFPHIGRFSALSHADTGMVKTALRETNTEELAQRPVTEISGGERQRLILARALCQGSPLLLMDEGTAAMDVHRKIDAFDLLKRKNAGGLTVVAVMHDLNLSALYCERLVFMKAGAIFAEGTTAEVFTKEIIEGVYETPVELFRHPVSGVPQAFFIPRRHSH